MMPVEMILLSENGTEDMKSMIETGQLILKESYF